MRDLFLEASHFWNPGNVIIEMEVEHGSYFFYMVPSSFCPMPERQASI